MAGPMLVTPGQTVGSSDWDALTQQHGGLPSVGQPLAPDDPANIDLLARPGMAATLKQHPIYRYYFADGTYVDAYTDENGQDSHIVAYKPSQRFTQQHPAAGTAAGGTNTSIAENPVSHKPSEMTTYPDGRPPTYDDTRVPPALAGEAKPPEAQDQGGRHLVWQANPGGPNAGGKWLDVGPGPETPAERQAREAAAPTQTVRTENGPDGRPYTIITIVPKPGQPGDPGQIVLGPDGKPAPGGVPGKTPQEDRKPVTVNGVTYIQVSKKNPDGSVELYHTDQQGKRVELPSEGAATAGGPAMPEIILGQSEQAARAYHTALANDPSLTPAQRKERFGEFMQTANLAVQEAATAQRDRESQRNADYNAASTRLSYMQTGMGQAMDYVGKLNGTLDPGSPLGGQAFAALMGLQLLQMNMSGINSLPNTSQRPAAPVPTLTAADMNDKATLAAKREEIAAHPASSPAATVTPPAAAQAPSSGGAVPPAAAQPAAAASSLPPNRPDQTQAAPQIENAINPPAAMPSAGAASPSPAPSYGKPGADPSLTGEPAQGVGGSVLPQPVAPPADTGRQFGPNQDFVRVENPTTGEMGYLPRDAWNGRGEAYPGWQEVPNSSARPAGPGDPVQVPGADPGSTVPYPNNAGAESKAPPQQPQEQFAALTGFDQPKPQSPPSAQSAQVGEPFAMRAARIKATPVWQLPNDDLDWAHANGLLDAAMAVPGSRAA